MSTPAPDGLVVVDKPSGWTSHDVVARTRKLARTRRVGHAGTLDPMATGVLLLGIGKATRLLGHLALSTKAYDATIRLGQTTVTDDAEGELVDSHDTTQVSDAAVAVAMTQLTGEILQVPSAVSAIKVDGRRAYARVRAGEDVQLEPRPVTVSALTVAGLRRGDGLIDLDVHVECSTGTYVRALARDLGAALGVGGHLTRLRRTRVGPFELTRAHTLEGLEEPDLAEGAAFDSAVVPLGEVAAAMFPTYAVAADLVSAVRHGSPLLTTRIRPASGAVAAELAATDLVALLGPDGEFLALYRRDGDQAKPVAVFASA